MALWANIFWGLSFIATKVALREVDPFTLLTTRFGIGAFLLLLVQFHKDKGFLKIFSYRDWIYIFLLAIVGVAGHILLQAYGLLYTTAINTGWIVAIYPIFITIAARLFLEEEITIRKIVGIILGFSGIFLIISKGVFITPIMMAGFLTVIPFSGVKGGWQILFHLSLNSWASILFLGIFCSGLAYLFWYSALEKRDSSVVGMYLYLEPFVTLIGAYLFLGEEIRWITLVGGGMTLLGVYLATRRTS